jgi:hypothetical protein
VLTGPAVIAGNQPGLIHLRRPTVTQDMVLTGLEHHPLTATAAVVWSGHLPRPLQQILFDAADGIAPSAPARISEHEPCRGRPNSGSIGRGRSSFEEAS